MTEVNSEIIIYNTDDGKADVKLYSKDGVIWMNQQQMALLFDTSKPNISMHIANILQDNELEENSVVKDYLATASDGKNYSITYYALSSDYEPSDKASQMLFAATQNKFIYAVTRQAAAELRAKMRKDLTMRYWEENVDKLIIDHDLPLLDDRGSRSHKQMEKQVEEVYIEFVKRRKAYEAQQADKQDEEEIKKEMKMLEENEKQVKFARK